MKVILICFLLSPLWVSGARFRFDGLSTGLKALVGSIGKKAVQSSLKVLQSEAKGKVLETLSRKLTSKRQENSDINLDLDEDIKSDEDEIGKFLDKEIEYVVMLIYAYFNTFNFTSFS